MALHKVTYVDDDTVIHASNLNEIQDEIIRHDEEIIDADTQLANLGNDVDNLETAVESCVSVGTQTFTKAQKAQARANIDSNAHVITIASFSSLPQTVNNSVITSDMIVCASTLSNPSAQTGNWTVTTADGSLTVSGEISGATALTLCLIHSA